MAWNEPGGDKDQDPWGSRKKQDGPPDLDELVRKIQNKFNGLFGGKGGGRGGGSQGGGSQGSGSAAMGFSFGALVIVGLVVWVLFGIYIVAPAEQGVVLRFGKYVATTGPGPHWHLPYPIETVTKVDVERVRRSQSVDTQMLTKDQNLIRIQLTAQFQVSNAENYLFSVQDPDHTLNEATESALRDVVGGMTLDEILSGGREVLVANTQKQIQFILNLYHTGLSVRNVNLEQVRPPEEVRDAFQDAINAEEDEDRFKKQAEAYANNIVPRAEGDAQALIEQALAYKQQIVDRAQGETSRFLQTLREYKKAPEITRRRMYIESIETVLKNSSKVVVKVPKGNSVMYLPLDRMLQRKGEAAAHTPPDDSTSPTNGQSGSSSDGAQSGSSTTRSGGIREREVR